VQAAYELGRLWYGDRFDLDWTPKSIDRIELLFGQFGMTGEFWDIR